jgi:hypothetical protein
LLAAKPSADGVLIYWRFDPWTGRSWGEVLRLHAFKGRKYDIIGLSPEGVAKVRAEAEAKYKASMRTDLPAPNPRPLPIGKPGRTSLERVDLAVDDGERADEIRKAFREGRASGFLTQEEWRKYWREGRTTGTLRNPGRTSTSVRAGSSNRILAHTFEVQPKHTSLVQRLKALFSKVLRFGTGR